MLTWEDTEQPAQPPHQVQQTQERHESEDEVIPDWALAGNGMASPVGANSASSVAPSAPNTGDQLQREECQFLLPTQCVVSAAKCVHIDKDAALPADVVALDIQVHCAAPLGVLLDRLADLLSLARSRIVALPTSQSSMPLSLDNPSPNSIYLADSARFPAATQQALNFSLGSTGIQFSIQCELTWRHEDVVSVLANIMSSSPSSLLFNDAQGQSWRYLPGTPRTDVIVTVLALPRGGMMPTVSPTQPYVPQQQEEAPQQQNVEQSEDHQPELQLPEEPPQPDVDQQDYKSDCDDPAHERDRFLWWLEEIGAEVDFTRPPSPEGPATSPRTLRRPARSMSPRRARPTAPRATASRSRSPRSLGQLATEFWSSVWPRSPPPAQPDRIARTVYVDNRRCGRIFASPTADVTEVMDEFVMAIRPLAIVQINPIQAIEWRHVEHIEIDPPPTPPCETPIDLREGRWERLERVRMVPVISQGEVIDYALFPWSLPITQAQYRLDDASVEEEDYWTITAVNCDTWIIAPLYLPPILRERLQDMEESRYHRGGMPETYVLSDGESQDDDDDDDDDDDGVHGEA